LEPLASRRAFQFLELAAARRGFNATQVLDLVEALGGRTVGSIKDGDERYNIRVRLAPQPHLSSVASQTQASIS
jgi:Cu/Ag efflux pump CusA